jgi:predicted DNA-binding transcriptional regulator AlpA
MTLETSNRRLVDTKQLAQYTKTSKSFWDKDRMTGETGCRFYKIGRRVLYDLNEIDAWLSGNQHLTIPQNAGVAE